MSSIVQRSAWRAARRPLARYNSGSVSASRKAYIPLDIDTNPEPVQDYRYAPPVSSQYLPPYGWDDLQMRRNFGDPPRTALTHFLLAVAGFTGVFYTTKWFLTPEPHFIRRTYPYNGLLTELGGLPENKARIEEENEE
ncbi:hypothetical protein DFJ43DRAFT_1037996 [Lentinula guzmanii]|uniref:Uncharacterized protein n=1 Tax=Lentinula guzmanii TaxID=2804957 RepID=A0AA38JCK2_9AGAR|nr:hypothetical protein DFJ43DRAFT_1037996 [Lentinula guzmanii]